MEAFAAVNAEAYSAYGVPPDAVTALFGRARALLDAPSVECLVAWDGRRPVGSALSYVAEGIGGIYWVATIKEERRRGIGEALSRAATNDIFSRGARASTLQASEMAEAVYRRIGYSELYRYRSYIRVAPR